MSTKHFNIACISMLLLFSTLVLPSNCYYSTFKNIDWNKMGDLSTKLNDRICLDFKTSGVNRSSVLNRFSMKFRQIMTNELVSQTSNSRLRSFGGFGSFRRKINKSKARNDIQNFIKGCKSVQHKFAVDQLRNDNSQHAAILGTQILFDVNGKITGDQERAITVNPFKSFNTSDCPFNFRLNKESVKYTNKRGYHVNGDLFIQKLILNNRVVNGSKISLRSIVTLKICPLFNMNPKIQNKNQICGSGGNSIILKNNLGSVVGNCTMPEIDSIENELNSPSSHSSSPNSWAHSGQDQNGGNPNIHNRNNRHQNNLEGGQINHGSFVVYHGTF